MAAITRKFEVEVTIPDDYEHAKTLEQTFGVGHGDFVEEGNALLEEFDKAPEMRIADFIARRLREGWSPSPMLIFFSFVQFSGKTYMASKLREDLLGGRTEKLGATLGGSKE